MEEKDEKTNEKVQALREMIYSAEKTLQGAKSMLLQLEGKKKVGRRKKISDEDAEGGRVIEGTFDGQIMIGTDGKQYPVPANYASKSKLVEGDMLKLTITPDGSFIYKQIGPTDRKRVIGVANLDADGDYFVAAEGKAYKILLASIDSDWGSIENVLQKTASKKKEESNFSQKSIYEVLKEENKFEEKADDVEKNDAPTNTSASLIDEWAPDLEELKKELNNNLNSNS